MIGFACKYIGDRENMNVKSTTQAYLYKHGYHKKLGDLLMHNMLATKNLLKYVSELPTDLRMVRLSSDLLPFFTHVDFKDFYSTTSTKAYIEKKMSEIGNFARLNGIKISFHPGQFTCIASDRQDVIDNSITELEYHSHMATLMGFSGYNDCKINIHVSGKNGVDGFKEVFDSIDYNTKKFLTVENTENKYDLNAIISLGDSLPIVFDIHHEFCRSGEYISFNDKRIQKVIESWNGYRPTMHYSNSRGQSKRELRAHSDYIWNHDASRIVLQYYDSFDIMIEAKKKNEASCKLYKTIKEA